jgi:3-oxoacyl-[acyl-carrier protein] reductase
MNLGLENKVALVTASSKGIGKAVAEGFASEGSRVAICARSKNDLIETANSIAANYKIEPLWLVCDINNLKEIEATVEAVKHHYGKIDILVNNCGGPSAGFFEELNEDKWNHAYEQILLSAVRFTNLVLGKMKEQRWGRVINITSISTKQPIDNLILSNSLRNAVAGMSKTLSTQYAKFNVTFNNVAPGFTLTQRMYELAVHKSKISGQSHEDVFVEMAKEIPMNRLAKPEEIASAAVFLASEQASYITGNTITVDGGWTRGLY